MPGAPLTTTVPALRLQLLRRQAVRRLQLVKIEYVPLRVNRAVLVRSWALTSLALPPCLWAQQLSRALDGPIAGLSFRFTFHWDLRFFCFWLELGVPLRTMLGGQVLCCSTYTVIRSIDR